MPSYLELFLIISDVAAFLEVSSHSLGFIGFLVLFVFCTCYLYIFVCSVIVECPLGTSYCFSGQRPGLALFLHWSALHTVLLTSNTGTGAEKWNSSKETGARLSECECVWCPPQVFSRVHILGFLPEVIRQCGSSGGPWDLFWVPVKENCFRSDAEMSFLFPVWTDGGNAVLVASSRPGPWWCNSLLSSKTAATFT